MGPFDQAWLIATFALAAPLLFAALGELISERSGVINVGLEGMMIVGAFAAFWVAWLTDDVWLGVLGGVAGGMLLAAIMALVTVQAAGDQIVAGLGLFIVGGGVTAFANQEIFAERGQVMVEPMARLELPLLVDIPVIGEPLFNQTPLAYLAYLAVPFVYVLLWRTPWGLSVRAAGEHPEALEANGLSVHAARWTGVLAAGIGGGLGGAMLTVGSVGVFNDGMSAGRGFIALAAVVFGRWRPAGVLGACLVFGAADALQLRLQALGEIPPEVWLVAAAIAAATLAWRLVPGHRPGIVDLAVPAAGVAVAATLFVISPPWSLPPQIWLMLPYVTALLVLAGLLGRTRMPRAIGQAYRRARVSV
ncbi:MAG: ABC transporter permease [Solirubrobacterales bacterium]